jgi:tetraacyldisaccharide 4'-kinase
MLNRQFSQIRKFLSGKSEHPIMHPEAFIISIGNITWGGTGKTALVRHVVARFHSHGYAPAVLSRGYGRSSRGMKLVSDGKNILCDWRDSGDEPYWLASKFEGIPVVVAEDRNEGLQRVMGFRPDIVVLDDAFQHRGIVRDLDVVLVDASEDLLKLRRIPVGKLREPVSSLRRADAIVLSHAKNSNASTTNWISENISVPVFHADYVVKSGTSWMGKKVAAFCGIGAPHHFFELLHEKSALLVMKQQFRDHHDYRLSELRRLDWTAMRAGAEVIVTTEKDAIRLEGFRFELPLEVVSAELKIEEEGKFEQLLLNNLRNRKFEHLTAKEI